MKYLGNVCGSEIYMTTTRSAVKHVGTLMGRPVWSDQSAASRELVSNPARFNQFSDAMVKATRQRHDRKRVVAFHIIEGVWRTVTASTETRN